MMSISETLAKLMTDKDANNISFLAGQNSKMRTHSYQFFFIKKAQCMRQRIFKSRASYQLKVLLSERYLQVP